jgi:hypothetical protein
MGRWGKGGESWMRGGCSAVSKAAFCRPPIGLPQFRPSTGEALVETAENPGRSSPDPIWGVTGCARLNAGGLGSVIDNSIAEELNWRHEVKSAAKISCVQY